MSAKWSAVQQTLNPVVLGLSPALRATIAGFALGYTYKKPNCLPPASWVCLSCCVIFEFTYCENTSYRDKSGLVSLNPKCVHLI